jgi:hypothetical protein
MLEWYSYKIVEWEVWIYCLFQKYCWLLHYV